MPALSRPRILPPLRAGFSLITTALLLTAAALVFVSVLPGQDYNAAIIENNNKLERIDEAMRSFMAAHGRRPCPADGQYAFNTPNFGIEAANPGTCQGGIPSAPLGPDTITGNLVGGTIPTKTLGLPDDYAVDAYGHRFAYIVDKRATANSSCVGLTQGALIIETVSSGAPVLNHVMYAYVSGGRAGDGMWPAQGGTRINTGSTDTDMQTDGALGGSNWLNNGGELIQQSRTPTFDDVVWYRPDLANTCALGALSVLPPGSCSTVGLTGFPATMTNTEPLPAYSTNSSASCPAANTLTCNNGSLSCTLAGGGLGVVNTDCQYASCSATCTETAHQGGLTLPGAPPNNTATPEFTTNTVTAPAKCDNNGNGNTLTCTNGTPSCSTGNMTNCQYSTCVQVPPGCDTSGLASFSPSSMTSGQSLPAYAAANDPSCTHNTLTCNSGTLTCTNGGSSLPLSDCNYSSCVQECSLTPNQGGGYLDGQASGPLGNTKTEFTSPTVASPGKCDNNNNGNTMTCTGTATTNTLTCSTGNMTNCQYANCNVTGGGSANLWVTDGHAGPNNDAHVIELDTSGSVITTFGSSMSPTCPMLNPMGLAFDSNTNKFWVIENQGCWPERYDGSTLSCDFEVGKGGGGGTTPIDRYIEPNGVAIDSSSNVWIADSDNNRLQEIKSDGTFKQVIPNSYSDCTGSFPLPPPCPGSLSPGYFSGPVGVALDGGGNLWVTDAGNSRVQELKTDGTFIMGIGAGYTFAGSVGDSGTGNGEFTNPAGLAFDSGGHLWVVDRNNNRVEEFSINSVTHTATFVTAIGAGYNGVTGSVGDVGVANGQFDAPYGIAFDSSNDAWVTDTANNRIQEFSYNAGANQWQWQQTLPSSGCVNGFPPACNPLTDPHNPGLFDAPRGILIH